MFNDMSEITSIQLGVLNEEDFTLLLNLSKAYGGFISYEEGYEIVPTLEWDGLRDYYLTVKSSQSSNAFWAYTNFYSRLLANKESIKRFRTFRSMYNHMDKSKYLIFSKKTNDVVVWKVARKGSFIWESEYSYAFRK